MSRVLSIVLRLPRCTKDQRTGDFHRGFAGRRVECRECLRVGDGGTLHNEGASVRRIDGGTVSVVTLTGDQAKLHSGLLSGITERTNLCVTIHNPKYRRWGLRCVALARCASSMREQPDRPIVSYHAAERSE